MEKTARPIYQRGQAVPTVVGMRHSVPVDRNTAPSAADLCVILALAALPALGLSIAVARFGLMNNWVRGMALLTLWVNTMIVLRDLRYGLALFLVAAALSPRLPGLYDNLRVEDLVFVLVFTVWVLKALQHGRIPLVQSPILFPFVLLTLMSVFSTVWGSSLGLVPDGHYSFFLQAKRIEYFLIFWVVATSVRSESWLRLLVLLFVVSGAMAALYGLVTASNDGYVTVASTRVSGPEGENYNTLSGYLILCIGAGIAALPGYTWKRTRALLLVSAAVSAAGLLFSYSREGYIMLMGSLMFFGFTRHRWVLIAAFAALIAAVVVAEPVRHNIGDTVQLIQRSQQDYAETNSLTARYSAWQYRWNGWFVKQPWIGSGVGSVALTVDNEYLLRACETGGIGFAIFLAWLVSIWRQIRRALAAPGFPQLLAVGLAAGYIGLLIQGCVAPAFTTIRTMEPFWFLLGLVCTSEMLFRPARPAVPRPISLATRRRLIPPESPMTG